MRSQVSSIRGGVLVAVVLVVLVVASLALPEVASRVRMGAWGVAAPVVSSIGAPTTAVGKFLGAWRDVASLRETVEDLQNQNTQLRGQIAALVSQEYQNKQLREQLGLVAQISIDDYRRVAADVVSFSPGQRQKWIMINRGSGDGVAVGDTVISGERVLVGVVMSVGERTAQVRLLTNSKSVVRIATAKSGTMGIVRGVADLGMRLTFVDRTQPLADGDQIVTAASDDIPAGLAIGTVRSIAPSADRLFHEAVIAPLMNLRNLSMVYVLNQ